MEKEKEDIFEIKKSLLYCFWTWNFNVDNCIICRNSLQEPSINYQAAMFNGEEHKDGLIICFGTCNHVYHLDCIQNWLNTRNSCPLCSSEWETSKIENICDYLDSK